MFTAPSSAVQHERGPRKMLDRKQIMPLTTSSDNTFDLPHVLMSNLMTMERQAETIAVRSMHRLHCVQLVNRVTPLELRTMAKTASMIRLFNIKAGKVKLMVHAFAPVVKL